MEEVNKLGPKNLRCLQLIQTLRTLLGIEAKNIVN